MLTTLHYDQSIDSAGEFRTSKMPLPLIDNTGIDKIGPGIQLTWNYRPPRNVVSRWR